MLCQYLLQVVSSQELLDTLIAQKAEKEEKREVKKAREKEKRIRLQKKSKSKRKRKQTKVTNRKRRSRKRPIIKTDTRRQAKMKSQLESHTIRTRRMKEHVFVTRTKMKMIVKPKKLKISGKLFCVNTNFIERSCLVLLFESNWSGGSDGN